MTIRLLEPPDHTPRKIVVNSLSDVVSDKARSADFVMPSDSDIMDALVLENGIYQRVVDKLGISESDVIRCITRNARALSTRLRSRLMLDTFSTLMRVQATLQSALLDMEPADVGRTYASTLAAFSNLAGQFEEHEERDTNDDADESKRWMIEHLDKIGKRESLQQAMNEQEQDAAG